MNIHVATGSSWAFFHQEQLDENAKKFHSSYFFIQETMEAFSSKDMAMKAQKKIFSSMANKSSVQMFIDDTTSEILDELYRVSKEYSGNRTEAQKVIKDLIKIAVKIGVLFRHNRFTTEELGLAQDFKKKLHQGAMTAISFHEVSRAALTYSLPDILPLRWTKFKINLPKQKSILVNVLKLQMNGVEETQKD